MFATLSTKERTVRVAQLQHALKIHIPSHLLNSPYPSSMIEEQQPQDKSESYA